VSGQQHAPEADYVSIIRQMQGTYFIGVKLAADILHTWGEAVVFFFQKNTQDGRFPIYVSVQEPKY